MELIKSKETEKSCQHYWIIEPADTKTSVGKCKYCGTVNLFRNSFSRFRGQPELMKETINEE